MPPYGEPDWATPGASTSGAPAEVTSVSVNTGQGNKALTKDRSKLWHKLISLFLIALCVAMVALGVFAILKNKSDFAEWFIASYMILFGVLLFLYEAVWWCTVAPLNKLIRKNFGFMYNIRGKALYLIFVAVLCIGINNDLLGNMDWLRWISGIGWGAAGIGLLVLSFTNQQLFENYYVPTKGMTDSPADDGINETV